MIYFVSTEENKKEQNIEQNVVCEHNSMQKKKTSKTRIYKYRKHIAKRQSTNYEFGRRTKKRRAEYMHMHYKTPSV